MASTEQTIEDLALGAAQAGGSEAGPAPAHVGPPASSALPDDVLAEAAVRVGRLVWVAVLFFAMALLLLLLQPAENRTGPPMWPLAAIGLGATTLGAIWLRFGRADDATKVDAGLAGHLAGGLLLALIELPRYVGQDIHLNGISSLVVWQLLFPGLVPQPRSRVAAAAAAIAVAPPIAAALATMRGQTVDVGALVLNTVPVAAAGGVAVAMAQILYALGRKVAEARSVGSYELESLLGKGGMGEVWLARHRLLARPAAIKLIRPEKLSADAADEALAAFEREAKATAQLRSPHTIELFDYGVADDGRFYYAMELLDGIDLQDLVAAYGPQPPGRVIHILRQAALSLGEAHERGLVHRDVSPRNVFLCTQGTTFDAVKVLDFGLVAPERTEADRKGDRLIIRGTPMTIAPETLRGQPADPRSDLYALGHVGIWLLTAGVVFEAQTRMDYYRAHLHQEPHAPSALTTAPVPRDLEAVLQAMTARDPASRPQNAQQIVAALNRCEHARRWVGDDARGWWRKRAEMEGG